MIQSMFVLLLFCLKFFFHKLTFKISILVRNKDNGERVVKSTEEIKLKDKAAELAAAKAKEVNEKQIINFFFLKK